MSHFVRASKYRHVFAETPKPEASFTNIPLSSSTGEQSYIKGNTKYAAVAVQGGGGPFAILPYDKPGRYERTNPVISGHTSAVLDFDFNPFHEQIVASCSEDCTVKVWGIPEGGLTETITDPLVDLLGHQRKVTLLRFHPTANNIVASASADLSIKLWNIEKGCEINSLTDHDQLIQDVAWDYTGALYATTSKDKIVRIFDPRIPIVSQTILNAHDGARSSKLVYLGSKEKLLTVGFTRQSQRQFKIWDPRQLSSEIKRIDIDQAAGVIMPFYDDDTQIIYLAGKGDGNIRYYEFVDENPWCFAISEFRSTSSAKGMAMIPKRGLDVMSCEISRLLKLTASSIEPLSFIVPRKSDAFQDDLFPPTLAGIPSCSAYEWCQGVDRPPVTMDLRPGARPPAPYAGSQNTPSTTPSKVPLKSPIKANNIQPRASSTSVDAELQAALSRVLLLEKVLKESGLRVP
jgi:coronin-1B/1C/6